jgi:hypothetical protein
MNEPHAAGMLREVADGAQESACRERQTGETERDARSARRALVAGSLIATAFAWLICLVPHAARAPSSLLLASARFVIVTVLSGVAAAWVLWPSRARKSGFTFSLLAVEAGAAWVLLPLIILLYWRNSIWMLLFLSFASAAMAVCIRRLDAAPGQDHLQKVFEGRSAPLFEQALPSDFRRWQPFVTSACLQGAILAAFRRHLLGAGILLSIGIFVLDRQLPRPESSIISKENGKKNPAFRLPIVAALAIFMTFLALLPKSGRPSASAERDSRLNRMSRKIPPQGKPARGTARDSSYQGIILWPVPKKKEILPPLPQPSSLRIGPNSAPLVIPFDGPYWYFKAPDKRPGPQAHVAHGSPTTVGIRSADWRPLFMQAHQDLSTPIDLGGCRGIEVAISNADSRPGTISLGVILTDSGSPGKPHQYLGEQPIVSSETGSLSARAAPAEEVLSFPIPGDAKTREIRRFDEITVVFLPSPERSLEGAKIAIRQFTLLPR